MWSSRLCVPLKNVIEYCNVLVVNVDGKFNCVMAIENDVGSAFAIHSVPIGAGYELLSPSNCV